MKLYRELKESTDLSDIPVLVVTRVTGLGGRSEDFERFLSTRKQVPPPDGFIAKPLDKEELLAKVKELLD